MYTPSRQGLLKHIEQRKCYGLDAVEVDRLKSKYNRHISRGWIEGTTREIANLHRTEIVIGAIDA